MRRMREFNGVGAVERGGVQSSSKNLQGEGSNWVDAISPKQFGWLSDVLLQRVAKLLTGLEAIGVWPIQLQEAIVHLTPQAAGGRRPVGLPPSLARPCERARKREFRKWREANKRAYALMRSGRGAEISVWAQSVYEETARGRGGATASVLSDLVRASGQVARHKVWEQGLAKEMPRKLLTLALEACAFGRRLTYRGSVSEVAWTLSAILAGSGFAGDMLFCNSHPWVG